jgi:3-oxoadipate enol-lactonase
VIATLTHRLEGEGPPVVLLNGGMMTFASWTPVTEHLRVRYRVLSLDLRGQWLSAGDPPSDFGGHVADLAALLDEIGWGAAHWVGASFGAMVGIEFAARWPARALSLIAITAMDRETPEFRRQNDALAEILVAIEHGEEGARERFHDGLVRGVYSENWRRSNGDAIAARRAQFSQVPLAWFVALRKYLDALEGFDLTASLARVACPSLVIAAAGDQVMDERRSRALAAALSAEILIHPTAGHGLVIEDPDWLAGVCLRFLDSLDAPP